VDESACFVLSSREWGYSCRVGDLIKQMATADKVGICVCFGICLEEGAGGGGYNGVVQCSTSSCQQCWVMDSVESIHVGMLTVVQLAADIGATAAGLWTSWLPLTR
jgi:hypothetical protein